MDNPAKLSATGRKLVADLENQILVSAATAWEIATKVRIGKFPEAAGIEQDFTRVLAVSGYTQVEITMSDGLRGGRFSGANKDPFDRVLAAQAIRLDVPFLSADRKLDGFGVHRIW